MDAVIYCRVSSWSQAGRGGLARQLEVCQRFASDRGYMVHAVFSEVGSGSGPMPVRDQAIRTARLAGADLLVEATDRYSRKCCGQPDAVRVVQCCPIARECEETIQALLYGKAVSL